MHKKVFFYCLMLMQCGCQAAESAPSEQQVPSLRWIAWRTIRSHADQYAKIPDYFMSEVEFALFDFESLDDDPFIFLQLAHALHAEGSVDNAVRYIATWMHRIIPGRLGGDVLQFAELSQKIAALPDGLGTKVWDARNEMNDLTGQFDEAPSSAQAE